jgi:hypothetical protein
MRHQNPTCKLSTGSKRRPVFTFSDFCSPCVTSVLHNILCFLINCVQQQIRYCKLEVDCKLLLKFVIHWKHSFFCVITPCIPSKFNRRFERTYENSACRLLSRRFHACLIRRHWRCRRYEGVSLISGTSAAICTAVVVAQCNGGW